MGGGGDTPGDKYEEAFGKLDEMLGEMPKLGKTIASTGDIAVAAGDVAREAVRLAGSGTGPWTAAEAKQKGGVVAEVNAASVRELTTARNAANQVVGLANQVTNIPLQSVDAIERLIWTNWIASLEGDKNEVLDNDIIQNYLVTKGMLASGYLWDSDHAEAVTKARKDYLRGRGIEPGKNDAAIDSLYRREMKLDALKRRLLGKRGRVSATDQVTIGDSVFSSPGMCGGVEGDEVVITFVWIKPQFLDQGINIEVWSDDQYIVMGNTVQSGAGRS